MDREVKGLFSRDQRKGLRDSHKGLYHKSTRNTKVSDFLLYITFSIVKYLRSTPCRCKIGLVKPHKLVLFFMFL